MQIYIYIYIYMYMYIYIYVDTGICTIYIYNIYTHAYAQRWKGECLPGSKAGFEMGCGLRWSEFVGRRGRSSTVSVQDHL